MTVLDERAASGIETKGLRITSYLAVGVLAAAVGVGAVLGLQRLADGDKMTPADIAELRAGEYADFLEAEWIAEVNATRGRDLVEFYQRAYLAHVAEINAQRASDMAHYQAGLHGARLAEINEQRAEDMVEFKRGWGGGSGN